MNTSTKIAIAGCLLLGLLHALRLVVGCSPADFAVSVPAPQDADAAARVDSLSVDSPSVAVDACTDAAAWCGPVGGCDYDLPSNTCSTRVGWQHAPPLGCAAAWMIVRCVPNPDGSGDGSPCLPELALRRQVCG